MRIIVDTNVLLRSIVRDDPAQAEAADRVMSGASVIAIALPCLCEFVWVLRQVYRYTAIDAFSTIEALVAVGKVSVNRPAVEAGLSVLRAGGTLPTVRLRMAGDGLGARPSSHLIVKPLLC